MEKERRKFTRFRVPFCTKFKTDEQSEGLSAVTRDISYGGVRLIIDTPQKILQNPQFYLEIVFPKETLRFCAKLVWVRDYSEQKQEAGLSFVKIPQAYREHIYKYILKYVPEDLSRF